MSRTRTDLRNIALTALRQYDLDIQDMRLVGQFTNTLYRVWARDPQGTRSYALRVGRPGWRTVEDLRSEGAWLAALARDPLIGAPEPVLSRAGDFVVEAAGKPEADTLGEPHRCVLTTWLPGVPLEKRMTAENLPRLGALFTAMGVLFTHLHEQALAFSPPPGFTTRRLDGIYARGETDVLFGDRLSGRASDRYRNAFTPRSLDIYAHTIRLVEAAFARLFRQPGMRVIHADLGYGNIIVNHARLHPLDFEDIIWGYPVQDIALAWFDLARAVPPEAYERLSACFRAGYESRLPWPESAPGELDTFRAARMIWVTNYVAQYEAPYLAQHIAWNARVLEHFLDQGVISMRWAEGRI